MWLTADFCEQRLNILILKGKPSAEHHVEDDSTTPNIYFRPGVEATTNYLRGSVVGTSTAGFEEVAVLDLTRETEVGNLHVQVIVKQDIFWLEISVDNLEFVAVFDTRHDLLEEPTGDWLGHASVRDDVLKQLATGKFEDDDDVGGGGDYFVSRREIGLSECRGIGAGGGRRHTV